MTHIGKGSFHENHALKFREVYMGPAQAQICSAYVYMQPHVTSDIILGDLGGSNVVRASSYEPGIKPGLPGRQDEFCLLFIWEI